jgi:methylated-DNA-[protein]-cysteine S-methyltransferase
MTKLFDATLETFIGWIALRMRDDHVCELVLLPEKPPVRDSDNPQADQIIFQLEHYLRTGDWPNNLPVNPRGTAFQEKVWAALMRIPAGRTVTYGELAKQLGTGARAIGGACRANPVLLLVPCHRVVAAHGNGGFAGHRSGQWVDIKRRLLQLEADG